MKLHDANGAVDIRALANQIQALVDERLAVILPAHQQGYEERFLRDGDMAYGALNTQLFQPVRTLLTELGLEAAPRLPGDFQESREWGNAEETHQQRWMWSMIKQGSGQVVGAIAVGSHHDHSSFRLPRSPEVVGISATNCDEVIQELGEKMPEFAQAQSFRLWYQDYLAQSQPAN
ncbi:MAG: DUF6022 family protein [Rhizobium sp.]|nr:DUF6022 family protein [Rhizobium sp.]